MKLSIFARGSSAARRGFTLIEMLVVISIIGIMTGLIVGASIKFREAQLNNSVDTQLRRLQSKLDTDYNEVLQTCHKEKVPPEIVAYCGGNEDRARAVHTAAKLRTNFPQTFAEAGTAITINGYTYERKVTFKSVWGLTAPAPQADTESAVLLYLILTERSTGGGTGDDAGTAGEKQTVTIQGKDFTIYIDNYKSPVVYFRWAQSAELDTAVYANVKPPPAVNFIDPLDPKNLVNGWTPTTQRDALNAAPLNLQFANRNRVPTVVSFGKDKAFSNFAAGTDDRVGYRLKRQGNQGNQP